MGEWCDEEQSGNGERLAAHVDNELLFVCISANAVRKYLFSVLSVSQSVYQCYPMTCVCSITNKDWLFFSVLFSNTAYYERYRGYYCAWG